MQFILPVESIVQNKGGVILYDPDSNKILKQYVHDKKWTRVGWRGGKLYGDYLIATDWNDLHYFNVKKWKYVKTFKKNTFNDLHYVEIHNDKLYIVNTGIDSIEIFKNPMNPEFENIHFVFEKNKDIFKPREIDLKLKYNEMMKVKPHSCHPNCIAFDKKRILVTCFGKNQKFNSGEVIELNTGKRLFKGRNFDCHDGIFNNNDFYLTHTRHNTILVYKNLYTSNLPYNPTKRIRIGAGKGWWRGMLIMGDMIYVFASDGYRKRKTTIRMATINTKTNKRRKVKLPVVDGIHWDTIYQPNLYMG
ncbi:MAG: hypothetical protein K9L62_10350 [Vallitaleaceae bacterium]|nr:hypothetical protein [Vallitaleaceae bacterium]